MKEFLRYYPKSDFRMPENIKVKDLNAHKHKRPFQVNKPESFWTSTYRDVILGKNMVSALAPAYTDKGELVGLIGLDYLLSNIGAEIENLSLVEGSYSFLINEEGDSIAMPDVAYEQILGRCREPNEYGVSLMDLEGPMKKVIESMKGGDEGIRRLKNDGVDQFVAYAPVGGLEWSLATVVLIDDVYRDIASLEQTLTDDVSKLTFGRLVPISLIVLFTFSSLAAYLAYRFSDPLRQLTQAASSICDGD